MKRRCRLLWRMPSVNLEDGDMKTTIITIGNGGYNIAADCIGAGIFSDYKLIVCDSDADDLKRNSASADCSFLLDRSVDKIPLNTRIRPIANEVTDRIYIFAALGGWVTRINILPLVMALDVPRKFIWSIFSMPSDFEGKEVNKRASVTRQLLWACTDMFLVQYNDKLSSIPDLQIGEMNEPIVNTLAMVSLFDIQKSIRFTEFYTEYIPEKYREAISMYRNVFRYPMID